MFIKMVRYCFIILCVFIISPAWANDALKSFFNEVKTIQASFSQVVVDDSGEELEQQHGIFYLSRPGKFRWDYVGSGQQIIADGKNIYMYDADLEQVTIRSMQNALNQVPSMLLVNDGLEIDQHFTITNLPPENNIEWVLLEPKQDEAGYEQLKIAFSNNQLFAIHLLDALGNDTRLQLKEVKQNTKLSSSLFRFNVPDGVDVLTDN